MKKPEQEPNMVKYFDQLTPKERAVICGLLNRHDSPEAQTGITAGTLPFAKLRSVLVMLTKVTSVNPDRLRIYRQIQSKLSAGKGMELIQSVRFKIYLDDAKVYRRFGRNPEMGKPLSFLQKEKVAVGFKNQFGRVAVDKDVLVAPSVALKRVSAGVWECTVLARCQHEVETWLVQSCR